jgi:hypothetical protein
MKKMEPSSMKMGVEKVKSAAAKTGKKQRGVPFKPGRSGNPNGRPAGSRNKATLAIESLLEGEAETLARKVVELAKEGDLPALRLCMDRLAPPRKDSPVAFDLPELRTVSDATRAMGALVKAVADGDLTPTEAAELTRMLQAFAKIVEVAEFEGRIQKLEEVTRK